LSNFKYQGSELEIFKHAKNFKNYYKSLLTPYIKPGPVLEVGAGIGEMTRYLRPLSPRSIWICLEPDKAYSLTIQKKISGNLIDKKVKVYNGILKKSKLKKNTFETILFIDSLEHIKKDKAALILASKYLRRNGKIFILAPAHNFIFSKFDSQIGHYRRSNIEMLKNIQPHDMKVIGYKYFDSVGLTLNLANKYLLKSGNPKLYQILFWDRCIVPISRILDKVFNFSFGKNILCVFQEKVTLN